jgi:hypothetical protein
MKTGKLFYGIEKKQVSVVEYDSSSGDYYALILEAQKKGCRQVILTSDIMIKIAEAFLTTESATITDIAFFVEDDNLQKEIAKLIELMRQNSAYWGALKDKLKFLSEDDSIDIKKISLQGKNDGGFLISLFVNGVISISESAYSSLSEKLSEFLKGCLR